MIQESLKKQRDSDFIIKGSSSSQSSQSRDTPKEFIRRLGSGEGGGNTGRNDKAVFPTKRVSGTSPTVTLARINLTTSSKQ